MTWLHSTDLAWPRPQALTNYRDGTFTLEEIEGAEEGAAGVDGTLTEARDEVWDMAACAAFKDAFDKRLKEASEAEGEEGVTAERAREIQRELEHNIVALEPEAIAGDELTTYLPAAWFEGNARRDEWAAKICKRFQDLMVDEIVDGGDEMSLMRRLLFDFRMEADPNSYAIMNLFVDRVRRSPKCFAMQFMAHLWSQERTHPVVLQVNYLGLHIYTPGEAQTLLASFAFYDSLVSWLALNDMLTVHVVHKPTKRSAKLHFLTREAHQIRALLTRYSEAVLQELQKLDRERALRQKVLEQKAGGE